MDRIDRRILAELQEDASLTNAELAQRVALSPSSCLRRVQRLRESGALRKIVALADADQLGRGLTAIVEVILDHHGAAQRQDIVTRLRQEPAVLQAWSVTGEPDLVVVMQLKDMKEYRALCDRLFHHDPTVSRFRTHFAMDCYKNETAIAVDVD
ncbi:Lrp/AsnC family transcriptional regulator [Telmatospirillum sp. J64-1]|uniref:Lrp/AsnC family transcriptional regulator n=1 Tax=Telmatospirillum sp. J64-1 TaxID=2502183 RepID=UPI00115DEDF6|nr:Lrp/AsnC family transcriptional regulator [Telmatospirillum sp. J64-1]